jgi:hypothetical protein
MLTLPPPNTRPTVPW